MIALRGSEATAAEKIALKAAQEKEGRCAGEG